MAASAARPASRRLTAPSLRCCCASGTTTERRLERVGRLPKLQAAG
jgi:hypothetical protein